MRFVLFVFIIAATGSWAQSDCHLIEKATVAYCRNNPAKAVNYLQGFRLRYREHPLYHEAHYLMALMQHKDGNDTQAIATANALLATLHGETLGTDGFDDCPAPTDSIARKCHLFRGTTDPQRLKDETNILLTNIYAKQKDYYKAIEYFNKVERFSEDSSNKYDKIKEEIDVLLKTADKLIYRNQDDAAVLGLLKCPYILLDMNENSMHWNFPYMQVAKKVRDVLTSRYEIDDIKIKVEAAIAGLSIKDGKVVMKLYDIEATLPDLFYPDKAVNLDDYRSLLSSSLFYITLVQ